VPDIQEHGREIHVDDAHSSNRLDDGRNRHVAAGRYQGAHRVHEIAAHASAAPGKGGVPLNMPIEVREVMSAPPADL